MTNAANNWGRRDRPLVALADAWTIIAENVHPLPSENVALANAAGRVLARPVHCDHDFPAFDKAMMDGFAIRAADCARPGARLRLTGIIAAGEIAAGAVAPGEAVRINTGAAVPPGADAVVRIEDTLIAPDDQSVTIQIAVPVGRNIGPRGSDCRSGDIAVDAATPIGPAQLGAIAAAGLAAAVVHRRAEAAIVSTGDELRPPGTPLGPGQIHESNGPMLAALVERFGGKPRPLGIVPDKAGVMKARLTDALESPVVVVCGGMSMGTLDLVPQVLEELGVRWIFHGIRLRPAKPVAYGRAPAGQHVFGLPGNPGSAFVAMHLLVSLAMDRLHGLPLRAPRGNTARLASPIKPHKDERPALLPGRLCDDDCGGRAVEPVRWSGSGDVFGLARADVLIYIPRPDQGAAQGEVVTYFGAGASI